MESIFGFLLQTLCFKSRYSSANDPTPLSFHYDHYFSHVISIINIVLLSIPMENFHLTVPIPSQTPK